MNCINCNKNKLKEIGIYECKDCWEKEDGKIPQKKYNIIIGIIILGIMIMVNIDAINVSLILIGVCLGALLDLKKRTGEKDEY